MNVDLTTKLGDLVLRSPIIVGSCPITTSDLQRIAMVINGVGAIVLPSINAQTMTCDSAADGLAVPQNESEYLRLVERVSKIESVPIIASLSGGLTDDWTSFPKRIEAAGAAAVELSVRKPQNQRTEPKDIEDSIVDLVTRVDEELEIPLFLKLSTGFTCISHMARRVRPCVQGLVLFGSSPVIDIELDTMKLTTRWGLSQTGALLENLETLMCVRTEFPQMPLVACGGIGSSIDLIKALVAGCDAATVTSAIYLHGPSIIGNMRDGLVRFMSDHDIHSIHELQELCPVQPDAAASGLDAFAVPN